MNDAVVDDWRWTNEKSNDLEATHPLSGTSSTWFLIELEFGNVGFRRKGTTGVPGEKPLGAKERTNKKSTHIWRDAGIWTQATLVGGECSHHCSTLTPRMIIIMMMMMMMIASEPSSKLSESFLWWWWEAGEENTYLPFSIFKMRPSTAPLVGGGVRSIFILASSLSSGSLITVW